MQHGVTEGSLYNAVGPHDTVVQDDAVAIITQQVDQIQQDKYLRDRMDKHAAENSIVYHVIGKHKQYVEQA